MVPFQKWQALGNDYLILERKDLPGELTSTAIERLCHRHFGVGADGVLLLEETSQPGFVARLLIFNPDGSRAELSGNGAREAIMYLRRSGWTSSDQFSIETDAGEIRPTITGSTTCSVDMGRAKLASKDFPTGPSDGSGTLEAAGKTWAFQHVSVGNPQCSFFVADPQELEQLDLQVVGGDIENHVLFPNRTNVSWYTRVEPGVIRARIFERGVGETMSSGTGATGAAVAAVLCGENSPVTVQLDGGELTVVVEEDLHVTLSGWAVPVYEGKLTTEFLAECFAA